MYDHVHTPPPPPSSRADQEIPAGLEALILDCLAKDREQRPASAAALQARLQALLLPSPWNRERAEAWWREHAPALSSKRPVADVVLSQEARPVRVIGRRRA
jgi:serine/threonine-protein kinase